MSSPTFFAEGSTPRPNDTQWRIAQKILGATEDSGGGGGGGITTIPVDQTLFVSKSGSDFTGARARFDKPFLTLAAAKSAAVSGDTIFVYPGTYNENDLLKTGVNWHFYDGANVIYTGTNVAYGIFDDKGVSATSSITGQGIFSWRSETSPDVETGVLKIFNSSSVINFEAKDISVVRTDDDNLSALITAVRVFSCSYVNVKCSSITCSPSTCQANAVWWVHGETYISADRISTAGGFAVWGDEDSPFSAGAATSMYVTAKYIISTDNCAIWYYADTLKSRLWVEAEEIRTDGNQPAVRHLSAGRLYVTAQKISNGGTTYPAISIENDGGGVMGYNWITSQKVASTFKCLTSDVGVNMESYIDVAHWEDAGGLTSFIEILGGTWNFRPGYMKALNGKGIVFSGGKAYFNSLIIDTSATNNVNNRPVTVSANGAYFAGCTLIAPALADSIYAGTAKNVGILGSVMANKAKNANVTLTPLGAFYVDAAVV